MTISVSATINIIIPPTTANTAAGTLPSSEVSSMSSVGVVVGVGTFRCMVETPPFAVDGSMPVSVVVGLGAFGVMVETPPFTVDDSMSPISSVGVVVGVGVFRILMVWVFITLVILPVGVSESVVEAVCKSKSKYHELLESAACIWSFPYAFTLTMAGTYLYICLHPWNILCHIHNVSGH